MVLTMSGQSMDVLCLKMEMIIQVYKMEMIIQVYILIIWLQHYGERICFFVCVIHAVICS